MQFRAKKLAAATGHQRQSHEVATVGNGWATRRPEKPATSPHAWFESRGSYRPGAALSVLGRAALQADGRRVDDDEPGGEGDGGHQYRQHHDHVQDGHGAQVLLVFAS